MSKAIDWTKPLEVIRIDGDVGEVLGVHDTNETSKFCVVRFAGSKDVQGIVFNANGRSHMSNIRNKPKEHAILGWLNCYHDVCPQFHLTRERADQAYMGRVRFACVPITIAVVAGRRRAGQMTTEAQKSIVLALQRIVATYGRMCDLCELHFTVRNSLCACCQLADRIEEADELLRATRKAPKAK